MKQKIFYINGAGGSGKDTFVDLVEKFVPVWKLSTVDEVKRIAIDHFGWDSVKDDKGRQFDEYTRGNNILDVLYTEIDFDF